MSARPLTELAARLSHLTDPDGTGVSDAELLRRFAEARDETAFELLVWRHGGLVLATCRRTLGRSADADDAFQATFLALARKAGAVRRGESLPGWLHKVALRAALRLRADADRRARLESHHRPEVPAHPLLADDTAAVLEEEIGKLPDKLRVAFVLCHIQGRTHEEAAGLLECPRGTVLSRVARARERLQARLSSRGFVPTVGLFVGLEQVTLPASAVAATVRAGVAFAAGFTDDAVSSQNAELARGLLRSNALPGPKVVAALAAVVLIAGVVVAGRVQPEDARPEVPAVPESRPVAPAPVPPPRNFKLATARHVFGLHFSPDSKRLVVPGDDRQPDGVPTPWLTQVWDTATGERVRAAADVPGASVCAFSPDGKLFATGTFLGALALVETDTWTVRARLGSEYFAGVSFSPDGKFVIGVTGDGAKVWNVATGKPAFENETNRKSYCVVFSPDGRAFALSLAGGSVRLIDAGSGELRAELRADGRHAEVSFTPDGRTLLTRAGDAVKLWDAATGKELQAPFAGKRSRFGFLGASLTPDGTSVVAVVAPSKGGEVWVWDVTAGKWRASFPSVGGLFTLSANGEIVAATGTAEPKDGRQTVTVLYRLKDGRELARLPGVDRIVFAADGKTVALLSRGDRVTVRDGFVNKPSDEPNEVVIRDLADLLKPGPK